jgi:hypothetical protein
LTLGHPRRSRRAGCPARDRPRRRRAPGTHEPLVAEWEQILEAAAAARQHDDVHLGRSGDFAQRFDHGVRGERALDEGLRDEDARGRKAGGDRCKDILLRRCVVTGDEPDAARQKWQWSLSLEHAFHG